MATSTRRSLSPRQTPLIARFALAAANRALADYEQDVARWREEGYGPHYCLHGTDLWVDYDNICGGCEDSVGKYEIALSIFYRYEREFSARLELLMDAHTLHAPQVVLDAIANWVNNDSLGGEFRSKVIDRRARAAAHTAAMVEYVRPTVR